MEVIPGLRRLDPTPVEQEEEDIPGLSRVTGTFEPRGMQEALSTEEPSGILSRTFGEGTMGKPWARGMSGLYTQLGNLAGYVERNKNRIQNSASHRAVRGFLRNALGQAGLENIIVNPEEEREFNAVSEYFHERLSQYAVRNDSGPTGIFAQRPDHWWQRLDPRRVYMTFAEGAPTTLGYMAGAVATRGGSSGVTGSYFRDLGRGAMRAAKSPAGMALAGAEAERLMQDMDEYELETGEKTYDPAAKFLFSTSYGIAAAVTQMSGIEAILQVGLGRHLRGKALRAIFASVTEGGVEALHETLTGFAEGAYRETGNRFNLPDDFAERVIDSFYGGVVVGGGLGIATGSIASLAHAPPPEASVVNYSTDDSGRVTPMFRVDKQGHPRYGEILSLAEMQDAGVAFPEYRRDLFKQQAVEAGYTPDVAELAALKIDSFARKRGVTTDQFLARSGLTVTSAPPPGTALYQFAGIMSNMDATTQQSYLTATQMEAMGSPREHIRQHTGFFRGEDGKWRYELDISKVEIKETIPLNRRGAYHLATIIGADSPIIQAYPELGNIKVQIDPAATTKGAVVGQNLILRGLKDISAESRSELRNTLFHEIQHLIQLREGFALGGEFSLTERSMLQGLTRRISNLEAGVTEIEGMIDTFRRREATPSRDAMLEQLEAQLVNAKKALEGLTREHTSRLNEAWVKYRDLAGEREARAAERRSRLTPEMRQAIPPEASFDPVLGDKVILEFQPGPAASRERVEPGPIWTSRMFDELDIGGRLPNQMTGAEALEIVQKYADQGKYKKEELEWSGLLEYLQDRESVTREDVLRYVRNGGVRVEEILLSDIPAGATVNRHQLREDAVSFLQQDMGDRDLAYTAYDVLLENLQDGGTDAQIALERLFEGSPELIHRIREAFNDEGGPGTTQFHPQQGEWLRMPGGMNYREVLLTLPNKEASLRKELQDRGEDPLDSSKYLAEAAKAYYGSHWSQPNVLAHIRLTDRIDAAGNRVLFVEEVQSDWHQTGRKRGYQSDAEAAVEAREKVVGNYLASWEILDAAGNVIGESSALHSTAAAALSAYKQNQVPDAPFKKSWPDLALKRVLRMAAESGYDYVALTRGDVIQEAVGGREEGQSQFYDSILPSRLKKLSKEALVDITLRTEVEGVREGMELTNLDTDVTRTVERTHATFKAVPVSDALYESVMRGQPLFQTGEGGRMFVTEEGQILQAKGAYDAATRTIHLMEGSDISTLMHELAHHFRTELQGQDLANAEAIFGVEDGNWTRANEEAFARSYERYLREGKTQHKRMRPLFNRLKEEMARIYIAIRGSEIDVAMSSEVKAFFDSIIEDVLPNSAEDPSAAKWWDYAMEKFSIRHLWERIGMPETGEGIRAYHSRIDAGQVEALDTYKQLWRLLKTDTAIRDALLTYESKSATEQAMAGDNAQLKQALEVIDQYFVNSLSEYKRYGGLQQGFIENMQGRIIEKLAKAVPRELTPDQRERLVNGEMTPQEMEAAGIKGSKAESFAGLLQMLNRLEDVNFIHIPLAFFEKYAESNPDAAKAVLRIMAQKERKSISLQDLINEGVIPLDAVKARDIFASYGHRKGRDLALLKIRAAALQEGAARPSVPGQVNDATWYSTGQPLFKGLEVNGALRHWIRDLESSHGAFKTVRDFLNASKVLAFYNPLILNSYNVIQLAMAGVHDLPNLMPAIREGINDWINKTDVFWEALDNGIHSQPFSLPYSEFRRRFARIEGMKGFDSPVKRYAARVMLGATMGATVGTLAVPGLGTVTGASLGVLASLTRPGVAVSRTLQGARRAVQGEANREVFADLSAWAWSPIRDIYEIAWDTAWGFDLMSRLMLNRMYLRQGMTPKEAAVQSAKVFGDYANVPAKTRKALNTVFFTPTYKIAMAQLFTDSIRSYGSILAGGADVSHKQRAAVVVNTAAILFGYDMLMMALGWERDHFGRRYYKDVEVEHEEQLNVGQPKELVTVFGGPHDLWIKYMQRISAMGDPAVPSPLTSFWNANRWELHPAIRVIEDMFVRNQDMNGAPIFSRFDNTEEKVGKAIWYATRQIVGILPAIAGEEGLDPQGTRLFAQEAAKRAPGFAGRFTQEYGEMVQKLVGAITFQYARDPTEQRITRQMLNIQRDLLRDLTPSIEEISRGMTEAQLEAYMDEAQIDKKINNALRAIETLQERLENHLYRDIRENPGRIPPEEDIPPGLQRVQ